MSTPTNYPHIEKRAEGKVWLTGAQTKVIEVALDRLAHHWDADEIQRQHPHLTLGQIHSCLAYYHDHQEEMDRAIDEQLRAVEELRGQQGESILRAKIKARGLASEAIYENGVLKPAQPLPLQEHEKVRISLDAAVSHVRRSAGLIGWTGSQEDADFVALSPELDPQEDV